MWRNVPWLGLLVILLAATASIVYELNPNASVYLYLTGAGGSTCTTRNEWIWIAISSLLLSVTPALERYQFKFISGAHLPLLSRSQVFQIFLMIQAIWISTTMYSASRQEADNIDAKPLTVFQWFNLLGARSAWPGLWNLAILIFPIQRTSALLKHLGVSHRDALCFHQWAGHAVLFWLAIHTGIISIVYAVNHPSIKEWFLLMLPYKNLYTEGVCNFSGWVGFLALVVLWLFSLPYVQRNHFELFFFVHLGMAPIFILFSTLHDYATLFFVQPAFVAWVTDRMLRRYSSQKHCRLKTTTRGPATNHTVQNIVDRGGSVWGEGTLSTVMGSSVVQITLPIPSAWGGTRLEPGTFVYLKDTSLSSWQSHPFSAQPSGTDSMTLSIKSLGDWSNTFVNNVQEYIQEEQHSDERSPSQDVHGTNIPICNLDIEGPYVSTLCGVMENYRRCYFVAGGIGIASVVDLCRVFHNSGRRYDLVWLIRTPQELAILEPLLEPLKEDLNTMSRIKIFVTSSLTTSEGPYPVLSTKCLVSYSCPQGSSSLFSDKVGPTEWATVTGGILSMAISFLISRLVACSYKSELILEQKWVHTCTFFTRSVSCVSCEAHEEHLTSNPCCTVGVCFYAFRGIPVLSMFLGIPLILTILFKVCSEIKKKRRWYDYHATSTVEMEDDPRASTTASLAVPSSSPSVRYTGHSALTLHPNKGHQQDSDSNGHRIQIEYQKPNLDELLASMVTVHDDEEGDQGAALVVCGSHSLVLHVLRVGQRCSWTHVKIFPIQGLPEGVGLGT